MTKRTPIEKAPKLNNRKSKASLEGELHANCGGKFHCTAGTLEIFECGMVPDVLYNVCDKCGEIAVRTAEYNRTRRKQGHKK